MSTPIILITGASRGIGRGIALACANAGYNLALTCHKNTDQLEETLKFVQSYGITAFGYTFDGSNATIRSNGEQFGVLAFKCKGCIAIKIEALFGFYFGSRTHFDGGRATDV